MIMATKATSRNEIGSFSGSYKMYLKDGYVVVEGKCKLSNFVGVFYLTDVQELVEGRS